MTSAGRPSNVFVAVILFTLIGMPGFTGCHKTATRDVSIVQEWFPNSNYAGIVLAQKDFAAHHNLSIKIIQGSDNINPVALVEDKTATFGDASADSVLTANQKGADLVILGVVSYVSPTVFLSKPGSKITSPRDFEGHKVGILEGTNTEYIYRALMAKNHVNKSRVKEMTVSFDIRPFMLTNQYDVRPAYIYDEPVTLEMNHIIPNVIQPSEWGVHFVGTVYFARRDFVKSNPELTRDFMYSVADGWRGVHDHPNVALDALMEYDHSLNRAREQLAMQKLLPFVAGKNGKVLWADTSDWDDTVSSLQSLKALSTDFNVNNYLDLQNITDYYQNNMP